ncbi:hypothetical protein GA0115259_100651, partial [Streptomyces sp. MnatMP-M17]
RARQKAEPARVTRRQGETLGLRWPYVDLEAELFHPKWQLQRLTWRHGCDDPHSCGARLHRFEPCPPDCTTHKTYKRGCPKPCVKKCTKHASTCPERKEGGLVFTRPKTKKSQNPVPIPPVFVPLLRDHKEEQDAMRAAAGELWQEHDIVFCRPDGCPLDELTCATSRCTVQGRLSTGCPPDRPHATPSP